ncbi:hypothetical protein BDP27DRAFT_1481754 [Rhodocollybia butyracea]|uniref:Uncharacterized protein n=1 Tax=Rhodocollybia butyracea TaxID=206335 RepID=A0A9P5PIG6_9AGAR|nr:hypothetical protein BDP27DRAFT_1481754 [Rhodocollybia butyracea]
MSHTIWDYLGLYLLSVDLSITANVESTRCGTSQGRTPLPSAPPPSRKRLPESKPESEQESEQPAAKKLKNEGPKGQDDTVPSPPSKPDEARTRGPARVKDFPGPDLNDSIRTTLSMAIFNKGFGYMDVRPLKPKYTGSYEPDMIGPTPEMAWIYLQFFNYKHENLVCTEAKKCWVWIAQGDSYRTRTSRTKKISLRIVPLVLEEKGEGKGGKRKSSEGQSGEKKSEEKRGTPYVCIGQGPPETWERDKVYGRPAEKEGEKDFVTKAKQDEWDRLWDEFNARFNNTNFDPGEYALKALKKASSETTTQAP